MKKLIFTIAAASLLFGGLQAKDDPKKITIDVKASKHANVRGANDKIKMDEPSSDVEMARPEGWKAADAQRGANYSSLNRAKHIATRGENTNIKKDIPSVDVEKVRPSYSNQKKMSVSRGTVSTMRGANTNIVHDIPNVDKEIAKPANYEAASTKGTTLKQVARKAVEKRRGANENIKMDEPSKDVEMAKPGK
jgi:hypothetical protein